MEDSGGNIILRNNGFLTHSIEGVLCFSDEKTGVERNFMGILHNAILSTILLFAFHAPANDTPGTERSRVLFVYDTVDKNSKFYIETIRAYLRERAIEVDDAAVGNLHSTDLSPYKYVVIYGMVMAFNLKSNVRKWVAAQKSLEGKNLAVIVTANRWFNESLRKDLAKLVEQRHGTVVDAVSMATNKMSGKEKKDVIKTHIAKLER
jgi:hypothetical protein